MKPNDKIYYLVITFCISLSFLFYSSNFYPLLNSDDALNILMAHYYKLPNDFYCWGQDRGGTLIPLLSQIFINIFSCSAVTSVSLSNYLILIAGFIGFSGLFKKRSSKLLFAIFWFFPFQRFIDLLRFPIGVQYSLIGLSIFLIRKVDTQNPYKDKKDHIFSFLAISLLTISIWVSDLSIVSIAVLLFTIILFGYRQQKKLLTNKFFWIYVLVGIIISSVSISIAKSFAQAKAEDYLLFNNYSNFIRASKMLFQSLCDVLWFQSGELFVSLYLYFVLIFIFALAITLLWKRIPINISSNKWIFFFLFDFLAVFSTFLAMHWVLANEMGRWYFVASYISLAILTILIIEEIENRINTKIFLSSLYLIAIVGAISPILTMKFVNPKTLKSRISVVGEFRKLGEIGVIAEFWNSFITSCPDPDKIKAVPHDKCYIRNQKLIDEVFLQPNIYIIKDMWMNNFPDTLTQFGYQLVKQGNNFKIGDCDVCKYTKIKFSGKYILTNQHDKIKTDFQSVLPAINSQISRNDSTITQNKTYLSPKIKLGIGNYVCRMIVKTGCAEDTKPFLDIVATCNAGDSVVIRRNIFVDKTPDSDYMDFNVKFSTNRRLSNLSFHISTNKNTDIYLNQLKLCEE